MDASILTTAHEQYKEAGFVLIDEQPHHSCGKNLLGQTWKLNVLKIVDPVE